MICNSPIFSISRLGAEIEIVQILEKFYSRALDQVKSQIQKGESDVKTKQTLDYTIITEN